ncbi:MAG: PAS domain-containing protein [Actinomycetota bacterium]
MASAFEADQLRDTSITWLTSVPGQHRIELRGDLDPDDATRYRRLGRLAIDDGSALLVDLAGVGIFGSWAVEALEDLRDHAARSDVTFEIIGTPSHVRRILDAVDFRPESRFRRTSRVGMAADHFFERADYESIVAQAVLRGRDSVVITNTDLIAPGPRIVFVNRAFTDLTGYSADEALGETPRILQGELTDRKVLDRLRVSLEEGRTFNGETINYRADGTPFVLNWRIVRLHGDQPDAEFYAALQNDVTEQRRLVRFETALTYLDSQLTRVEADPDLDAVARRRWMVDAMLDAHVSLMEGGHATAVLTTQDGRSFVASTSVEPSVIEAGVAIIESGGDRSGIATHDTLVLDRNPADSALLIPVAPHRRSEFSAGSVVLHGMPRDRLRLADPHLHAQITTHGLCRSV